MAELRIFGLEKRDIIGIKNSGILEKLANKWEERVGCSIEKYVDAPVNGSGTRKRIEVIFEAADWKNIDLLKVTGRDIGNVSMRLLHQVAFLVRLGPQRNIRYIPRNLGETEPIRDKTAFWIFEEA